MTAGLVVSSFCTAKAKTASNSRTLELADPDSAAHIPQAVRRCCLDSGVRVGSGARQGLNLADGWCGML